MSASSLPYHVAPARQGEHQLIASKHISKGDVILTEEPLLHIPVLEYYRWGSYAWDMVDTLLSDPALLAQYDKWKLCQTEQLMHPEDLGIEKALMQKHGLSRKRVRGLYFSVGTNNVGVPDEPRRITGYGLYEMVSRSDHSCAPSASLMSVEGAPRALSLIAKRDIAPREPITWSYFSEAEFLPADVITRNASLLNLYRFVCRCERCKAERPPEFKREADFFRYLDSRILEEAKKLLQDKDGLAKVLSTNPMDMHRKALR